MTTEAAVSGRDTLEFDVLVVGGGPAGLSAALRLAQLRQAAGGASLSIAVIEKAREAGAHSLSGAVLDLSTLCDLIPDYAAKSAPVGCAATNDRVYFLTSSRAWRLPVTPPPLVNHGAAVISLQAFTSWLASQVEAAGVDVFTGFAASEVLYDDDRVVGVRTGDRGRDRHGAPNATFEPGVDLRAKVTIFCDGVRGNLTKTLIARHHLDRDRQPQTYALGIKELWELRPGRLAPGSVVHTLGHPFGMRQFGGGFIYGLPGNVASVGLVSGLDYEDPRFDPHQAFQHFKGHPFVRALLDDGTLIRYGAKALPEGGWHTIPRPYLAGALIAGDAGSFLNSMRLKGIHLAMRTGMLAAETAFEAVRGADFSEARLASYARRIDDSVVKRELYPVRNVHQAFEHGLLAGAAFAACSLLTGGWWFVDPIPARAGHERMLKLIDARTPSSPPVAVDRRLTFDRVTSVHHSGTHHREDAPSHLIVHDLDICRTRCIAEYGNPCTRYCPAQVYEMVADGSGGQRLQINASNCVHCRTCDILDPYQIVDWVPPEGGDGPNYTGM